MCKLSETKLPLIEPIRKQLDKKMDEYCVAFKLYGTRTETPRFLNFGGFNEVNNILTIKSTQNSRLGFTIVIHEGHPWFNSKFNSLVDSDTFWEQFREYRTEYLLENHPTISPYSL